MDSPTTHPKGSLATNVDLPAAPPKSPCSLEASTPECLHDAVAQHVALRPQAPAVVAWDDALTFAELDFLSDHLAHALTSRHKIGSGDLVPVCFEKSAWAVVAMLGVLKAGAGFAPLHPQHPVDRLRGIVQDTGARVVLTSPALLSRMSVMASTTLVVSRAAMVALSNCGSHPGETRDRTATAPNSVAYAIFTSGSTGRPKGVLVEHRNIMSAIRAWRERLALGPTTRFFQFTSYAWDVSVMEIFSPLVHGGCVCIPSEGDVYGNIERALVQLRPTHFKCPTSYLQLLSPAMLASVPSLSVIMVAGEVVPGHMITTWAPHVDFAVTYGPTECAVSSSITPKFDDIATTSAMTGLIGEPVGCEYWLVDPENSNALVQKGEVAELLIAGPNVGRGYLNDEEKSRRAFIDPPSWYKSQGKVGRFYLTGDLVQRKYNGQLVMLGRKDTQVKIRGVRVDLGEIEHHLGPALSPGWSVCVEKMGSGTLPDKLVAFVRMSSAPGTEVQECQAQIQWWRCPEIWTATAKAQAGLELVLPDVMRPSVCLPMASFPTTASGKVDRKVLRSIGEALTTEQVRFLKGTHLQHKVAQEECATEMLSDMEKELAEIWAEVLQYPDSIAATDNLFRLGGDSFTAIRVCAAAYQRSIILDGATVLANPVLRGMAREAKRKADNAGAEEELAMRVIPFQQIGGVADGAAQALIHQAAAMTQVDIANIEDIYPCNAAQTFMLASSMQDAHGYVSQYAFRLPSDVDLPRFERAWGKMLREAKILRTRGIPWSAEKGFVQVVVEEDFAMSRYGSLEDCLAAHEEKAMGMGQPMSRYALAGGKDEEGHVFVWSIHHAISDARTLDLVLDGVRDYYFGRIPDRFVPYSIFSEGLPDDEEKTAQNFWLAKMKGVAPLRGLLAAGKPPAEISAAGKRVHAVSVPLNNHSSSHIFPSIIVRAALALTLAHLSEANEAWFVDVLSGRDSSLAGADRVLGPTDTALPLTVQFDPMATVLAFLERVQQENVARIANQRVNILKLATVGGVSSMLAPQAVLNVRHTSLFAHNNGLFQSVEVDKAKDKILGVPLVLTVDYGHEMVEEIDYRYDETILGEGEMDRISNLFETCLAELSVADRTMPLERVLRKLS